MNRRSSRLIALVGALAMFLALGAPAHGQTMSSDQRAEFNKLLQQRNRLTVQLRRLDEQASDRMKQGRDPIVVHAEQVSVQDQIDLAELRLAILATRYGVDVPPPPGPPAEADGGPGGERDPRVDRAFARGRHRALEHLRSEGLELLAAIDFSAFLED